MKLVEAIVGNLAQPVVAAISAVEGLGARHSVTDRQKFVDALKLDAHRFGDTSVAARVGLLFFPQDERKSANCEITQILKNKG